MVLNNGFQVQRPLLIEALVESQPGLDSSAGIDTGGTHQAWQQRLSDDGAIKQRPKERNLWFLHDLDEIHVVLHRVDDNQHVSEVSWDDTTSVVPGVL